MSFPTFFYLRNVIFAIIFITCISNTVNCISRYVDNYERLNYRPLLHRQKRSLHEPSSPIELKFSSFSRNFHLILYLIDQNLSYFANDHLIDVDGKHVHDILPHSFLYEGRLRDDPSSHVYGSIIDGIFDGHIITGSGKTYSIEKSSRYFLPEKKPAHFHSVIYPDENISYNKRFKRGNNESSSNAFDGPTYHSSCGLTKEVHESMHNLQQLFVGEREYSLSDMEFEEKPERQIYHQIQQNYGQSFVKEHYNRVRRSNEFREIRGRKIFEVRTCSIYLQTDHKLYEHIFYKEGGRDHIRTREEIVSLLYNHIKAVNQIYEGTDFGGIRGINFAIQRITIYTSDSCLSGKSAPPSDNPFCEENVDVSNYLNLNSQKDHSAFCLAYALTYRDFTGGTLGLAWVASPSQGTAGGICQTYQRYNEHSKGGVNRSLNTGIITLVNYGNRVPLRVSQLTLAHEIGHNFGSPHDFPSDCQPGLPNGNFIMFASATSGDKPNNSKFSSCSIYNITEVLYEVLQQNPKIKSHGKKRNCFTDQRKSFCGNQIREPGEECDCGFTRQDCDNMGDKCCIPRDEAASDKDNCKRKPGKRCSPSEGSCCNPDICSFYTDNDKRLCREDSECQFERFCDGKGAECPESIHKQDGLPCQNSTKVCHQGACNGSICSKVGLKDCFLTEGKPEHLCFLACEKNGVCLSSAELSELKGYTQYGRRAGQGLLLHPGSPCNNYKGYCDIFRKCRSVDANGPLARLKSLMFNPETINTLSQWVKENWWACVFLGIGTLMLMALFVKCCAVHTPSTNPNKLPHAHLAETIRHPGTLLRRGQQQRPQPQRPRNAARPNANGRRQPSVTTTQFTNMPSTSENQRPCNSSQPNSIAAHAQVQNNPTPICANAPPVEPPPPYQLIDPASSANKPTSSLLPPALSANVPVPVSLPSAPLPTLVPLSNAPLPMPTTSSSLPLIPGPPMLGQGPKAGRRRPKANQQQNKMAECKEGKNKGQGFAPKNLNNKRP